MPLGHTPPSFFLERFFFPFFFRSIDSPFPLSLLTLEKIKASFDRDSRALKLETRFFFTAAPLVRGPFFFPTAYGRFSSGAASAYGGLTCQAYAPQVAFASLLLAVPISLCLFSHPLHYVYQLDSRDTPAGAHPALLTIASSSTKPGGETVTVFNLASFYTLPREPWRVMASRVPSPPPLCRLYMICSPFDPTPTSYVSRTPPLLCSVYELSPFFPSGPAVRGRPRPECAEAFRHFPSRTRFFFFFPEWGNAIFPSLLSSSRGVTSFSFYSREFKLNPLMVLCQICRISPRLISHCASVAFSPWGAGFSLLA